MPPLDRSHKGTVPRVAITPLGKHAGHFLQGALVCGTSLDGPAYVGVYEESANDIRAISVANVGEHLVKSMYFLLSVGVLDDAAILPKNSELEILDPRQDDERRPARRRRELPLSPAVMAVVTLSET